MKDVNLITHLIIHAVEQTWYCREDGRSQRSNVVHQYSDITLVEANAGTVHVHVALKQSTTKQSQNNPLAIPKQSHNNPTQSQNNPKQSQNNPKQSNLKTIISHLIIKQS